MSASVFKPIHPFRIESARLRLPLAEKSPLKKVRRVLFEPIDHAETRLFLERELARHTVNETAKWEFDFREEVPLSPTGTRGRFVWKAVRQTPETITYAPKRRRSLEETDNSSLYPQMPEKTTESPLRSDGVEGVGEVAVNPVDAIVNKKQSKITDFMQARKRTADPTFKKLSSPRPPKINRETCS